MGLLVLIIYVVFIIFCRHLMLLTLCRLVGRRTWKTKCILLNNEQGNKVNSQRSFSCISVDFSGEDQQALFLSLPIRSTPASAVKLGSEETEEKSICVSVWPLIFSLLPSFLHTSITPFFPPLLFLLSQRVRSGQSILTPSTGQVRTSNIPWIHTFSASPAAFTQAASPPTLPSSNCTSISQSSPFLFSPSPPSLSVRCLAYYSCCSYLTSKRMKNTQQEDHIIVLTPTSTFDLNFVWII